MKRLTLLVSLSLSLSLVGCATDQQLGLRRVVLYQNGIGYFERSGELHGERYYLQLREHEVGDVLKSMVVIDNVEGRQRAVSAVLPAPRLGDKSGNSDETTRIELLLRGAGPHHMSISYAAPTPVWKPSYRIVLPDSGQEKEGGLLQAWAVVNNASGEAWREIELVLATGAPLSFAVDLQTPHFVARPDGNGQMVQPLATGLVGSERGRALEGTLAQNDRGDQDSDGDRIADRYDKCPNEPETYNGIEDEDGCPDRGRVMVTATKLEILDRVYFESASADLKKASEPLLDTIVAVLNSNPELTQIEIQGHACSPEKDPRGLSERRAAVVQRYLIRKGVAAHRLVVRGYGSERPLASPPTAVSCDSNRRVEFSVVQRRDEAVRPSRPTTPDKPTISADTVAQSGTPGAAPTDLAGASHYQVSDPVNLPKGASTMVSMLTLRGGTEDIFLYRPDGRVRTSERHPLRAARVRIGMALEPGPVSVFARGSFVGEGALGRMQPGETALVPYALDSSASIERSAEESTAPLRLLSLSNGEARVEDESTLTTRYQIRVGAKPPARIFVRHPRRYGYTVTQLPPETEEGPEAYLVPQALVPDGKSELVLSEKRALQHTLNLRERGSSICPYAQKAAVAATVSKQLGDLCQLQKEAARADVEQPRLRQQLDELRDRAAELRNNLGAIEKITGAAALRTDLLGKLADNEKKSGEIQKQLIQRSEAQATLEARLVQILSDLTIAEAPAK